ncbi:hypothetical protein N7495_004176 [Penicillium taxi]|uniref:uncharacterized protein n=1 Tax=Penicillium taxi TaxID=168475 RepID=UPI00254529D3|nr:uncharacterized protein N7495_004176 [Penicillium taxi]KAJ5899432.1 hypothetical protein N7495_004176 [Penicillium taxi]
MKTMIRELEGDMTDAQNGGQIDSVALAAKYTHSFVNIHPFVDGNGRMCRLILSSLLFKLGMFLVTIGEKNVERSQYLEVVAYGGGLEEMYKD